MKANRCEGHLFLIYGDLTLVTGPVFSLREQSKDVKRKDFGFQVLGKATGFRSYFILVLKEEKNRLCKSQTAYDRSFRNNS